MMSIFKKEISQFLSSITGLIALIVFLIASALVTFVFPETSVLEYGYATLTPFFDVAPFILLFLIPAITMKLFAEERASNTLELLRTKPLTYTQIIGGKFLAAVVILFVALLPTILYAYIIGNLAEPAFNIDQGAIIGSYIGLFALGCCFISIGVFASSISNNQIMAFIIALFLCFVMYYAFTSISTIPWVFGKWDYAIQQFGLESHYTNMSKGAINLRDSVYFLSIIIAFLLGTVLKLNLSEA